MARKQSKRARFAHQQRVRRIWMRAAADAIASELGCLDRPWFSLRLEG